MKNFNDVRDIYSNRLSPEVKNGIVSTKHNKNTGMWISVFRLEGKISCRVSTTKEKAVYLSYIGALSLLRAVGK